MKCPKCQYISFDSAGRCRNCGYDFSLSPETAEQGEASDLRIQNDNEPVGPYGDFSLNPTPNLPLFTRDGDPDAPLVTPSAVPRAPLAVRRTAPAAPRPRQKREPSPPEPRLALDTADLTGVYSPAERVEAPAPETDRHAEAQAEPIEPAAHALAPAGAFSRLAGGMIDLLLIGGIDLAVVYFTLKICELTFAELYVLPVAPMVSFLLLLNGGYIATFVAASGQTIGKMAVGTRVIPADPSASTAERVTFGQSIIRAVGYVVSALPLGLGFVPAFVGRERRALHDRLADTRVVKA